jgi:transmembrane sensor
VRELPTPVRRVLQTEVDETTLGRVWRGIQRRRAEKLRQRASVRWGAALVAAAAVIVGVFVGLRRAGFENAGVAGRTLQLAGGGEVESIVAPAASPRTVAFSDSSRIDLSPGARIEPLENGGTWFSVLLAKGRATFDVHPGGPRRWTVECGLLTVEVVGTRFTVERTPEHARVDVERGVVLVRGDRVRDHVQRLAAGDSLEVEVASSEEPGTASSARAGEVDALPPAPKKLPSAAAPRAAGLPPDGPVSWRTLAQRGDHARAYAELGSQGIATATQSASADDLLALADVARLSGHPADAVAPLSRVVSEHGSDPRASLAAFTLGRVHLDALSQPSAAAGAFERAIALGLPQSLEGDAYARLVEARARAGDAAGAQAAASEYQRRFPTGDRLNEVRKWSHAD